MDRYDAEILERLIRRETIQNTAKYSIGDNLEAMAEAFDVNISEEQIKNIKENNPGFFENPKDILSDLDIEFIKGGCDEYHKKNNARVEYFIEIYFECVNSNSFSSVEKGVPSIFVEKNSDRYTFLVLEDFDADIEHQINGDKTSLFVTEPNQGKELENMLKEFSDHRQAFYDYTIGRFSSLQKNNKALYHSVGALSSLKVANLVLLGTLSPLLGISAGLTLFTGFATTPYLIDNYRSKNNSKKIKEIRQNIDENYIRNNESLLYIGSMNPYDPEIILRGLTIAKVKDQDYILKQKETKNTKNR